MTVTQGAHILTGLLLIGLRRPITDMALRENAKSGLPWLRPGAITGVLVASGLIQLLCGVVDDSSASPLSGPVFCIAGLTAALAAPALAYSAAPTSKVLQWIALTNAAGGALFYLVSLVPLLKGLT